MMLGVIWMALLPVLAQAEPFQPRMVLIIDDMGYNQVRGERALALPGAVTYSMLPFTPYARQFAEQAHLLGREVMLHAPMANVADKALGPGALTADMDKQRLQSTLRAALASVPHVSGMNNHMGSRLTRMPQPMQWVIDEVKAHKLYFIDSVTTLDTVGWKTARANNVPYLRRHVFLDHVIEPAFIARQFEAALSVADKYGYVVVIGHPHDETLTFLHQALPDLAQRGVRLVPASTIVHSEIRQRLTEMAQRRLQLADASE